MNTSSCNLAYQMIAGYADRLQTATENLSNSATPGYQRSCTRQPTFDSALKQANSAEGRDGLLPGSGHDVVVFEPGPMRATGNPMDFAVEGSAFFVVGNGDKEYYTRNGRFRADADGTLVTQSGLKVKGQSGNITIPDNIDRSTLSVDPDGTLRAGSQRIARVRIAEFSDTGVLQRAGDTLFSAPQGTAIDESSDSRVVNRSLEGSNTCVFEEMAELIECMRGYEASQKMLKMEDRSETAMIEKLS